MLGVTLREGSCLPKNAAWIVSSIKPLGKWCNITGNSQGAGPSVISPEILERGLLQLYELERGRLAQALQLFFPGGKSQECYEQRLDELHEALTCPSFWKAYCMFDSGTIPSVIEGLSYDDLCTESFLEAAKRFLATNYALCFQEMANLSDTGADSSSPVTSAAVRASAPLAPSSSLSTGRQLSVEVLSVAQMGTAEYRVGDLTAGLLRAATHSSPRRNPYVEVRFGSEKAQTRVVQDVKDEVHFGERLVLAFPKEAGKALEVGVFDARRFQSTVRGDPLIGRASLPLDELDLGEPKTWTLQLARADKVKQGSIVMRIGVTASEGDYNVLAKTNERTLAELTRAMANVLSQPSGVEILMCTRPKCRQLEPQEVSMLRKLLSNLVARMNRDANLVSGLGDEAALVQLARTSRAARQIVAIFAPEDASGEVVQELAQDWLRSVLVHCLPPGSQVPCLNQLRLARLLEAGEQEANVLLEDLGASVPDGTPMALQEAVTARLAVALHTDEEEIFSGDRVFKDGRIRPGMAAVLRPARDDNHLHIFLYDLESIHRWQAARGQDPTTRERLEWSDILPLS